MLFRIGALLGVAVLAACASSSATVVSGGEGPGLQQARTQSSSLQRPRIAVSRFEVRDGPDVGLALGDFLSTALVNSDRFVVLERARLDDLRAEQQLQSGADFDPATRVASGGFEGAELLIRGAIVNFEPDCKGVSVLLAGSGTACTTLNLRIVDVASGRIVNATTVESTSRSSQVGLFFARGDLPIGLGAYANTPMETALRNAIEKAVQHIVDTAL